MSKFVSKQHEELKLLNFTSAVEVKFANQYKSQAKCKTCRVYVEVPNVWDDGAGADARAHFDWHKRVEALMKETVKA
jgi:hypothetical protein